MDPETLLEEQEHRISGLYGIVEAQIRLLQLGDLVRSRRN